MKKFSAFLNEAQRSFAAKEAEKLLTENGEEDSAFYFGQLKDWLVENPSKGFTVPTHKILGL